MMSPIRREIDETGIERTLIFGADVRALGAVGAVIGALVLYAGPIVAGTIYLQNMFNSIQAHAAKQDEMRKVVNEASFSVLRQEVDRIKSVQDQVVAGQTAPQQLMRSALDRIIMDHAELSKASRDDLIRVQTSLTSFRNDVLNLNTPLSQRVLLIEDRLKKLESTVAEFRRDIDRLAPPRKERL